MAVGYAGVTDYTNTSSGDAVGVVATGYIGGSGVVARGGAVPPPPGTGYICTQSNDRIEAENADNLITET